MKRQWFGLVLLASSAFLLVVGTLCVTWAPDVIKKTPLDISRATHLDGTVQKLDSATSSLGPATPVKVLSRTNTDTDASDDDVVLWVQSSCVWMDVDDAPECPPTLPSGEADPRIVSVTYDVFATDRYSAEAINDEEYLADAELPEGWLPHVGLVNKWPFDTDKDAEYLYWDGTMGEGVPAVFEREDDLLGIDVYVYSITITDAPIEIAEGTPGTYDNRVEIWVEPRTGSIQQQTQDQQRYLADGTQVLDLKIGFTEDQQQAAKEDADGNLLLLDLITVYLPVVGFVGGALCLLAGAALLLSPGGRRRSRSPA